MCIVNNDDFLDLPRELQVAILSLLDIRDSVAVTRVSRYLHALVQNTPALQYPIELAACGMSDNQSSATALCERLNNLRRHDRTWRTLCWSHDVRLSVPSGGRMESKQGLITITKERDHPERAMDIIQLPSNARSIALRRWTIRPGREDDPAGNGQVYDVDASQDLLVIRHGAAAAHTVFNVYSLSEGLPHSLAARPRFSISNAGGPGVFNRSVLGAHVCREWVYLPDETFQFYNWRTGALSGDYDKRGTLTEPAFLSDRFIATIGVGLDPSPAVLLVHELPSSNPHAPPLYPTNVPILALFLPEIDGAFTDDDDSEWELVGGSAHSAAPSARASGGDFWSDADKTLLLIHFRVRGRHYELLLPAQRVLELLPPPENISMGPGSFAARDVPWPDWGPELSHVRECAPSGGDMEALQSSVFGMRHVIHHPVEWEEKAVIRVNDYQSSRVSRAEAHQTPSCAVRRVHIAEGEWVDGPEMQTELPYIETNIELPVSWREMAPANIFVSINEDGILLIDRESGEVEHGEAHTF
ncbi:unnamed protein product [Peniophora sp. CBMAI 1063]|nr:unnamed protein product [Peniophora sp. CBMAI 1063]